MTLEPNPEHRAAVSIVDYHVTLPPRASLMIAVYCEDAAPDTDAIAESDQRLLIDRDVSVARTTDRFSEHQSHVLVTYFTEDSQHLNKGAAIAFLEETQEASDMIVVAGFERTPEDTFELPQPFDVNLALPQEQQNKLLTLLCRYSECFSSNSKVRRTPLAKHRIITENGAPPTRQSLYRVSSPEREAIRTQVDDMLIDDVIQP